SLEDDLGKPGSEIKNQNARLCAAGCRPILALGAHLKSTIALSVGPQVFISQHIGDLETDQAYEAFRRVIADFKHLYDTEPAVIAADVHPDYISTRLAKQMALETPSPAISKVQGSKFKVRGSRFKVHGPPRLIHIQHHLAHILSCMAENELTPPALGVSWDGTG